MADICISAYWNNILYNTAPQWIEDMQPRVTVLAVTSRAVVALKPGPARVQVPVQPG
jgi:hypothetical protein